MTYTFFCQKFYRKAAFVSLAALLSYPATAVGQSWKWKAEQIDTAGMDSSITVDRDDNVHVSYRTPEGGRLKYAFRPVGASSWSGMTLESGLDEFSTRIAVDLNGNPYICYTPRNLKFARWDGRKWLIQEISPGGGLISYMCSVSIAKDGTPHISWYVESGTYLRYAYLENGSWQARTLDLGGLPGKWNTMLLDDKGFPHISYNHFPSGAIRYIYFDGTNWVRSIMDSAETNPQGGERGMGNSLALDADGNPWVTYYDLSSLKLARFRDGKWTISTVEELPNFGHWAWKNFRSTIVMDAKNTPHIVFESLLGLQHAWWDGKQWHIQLLVAPSGNPYFDNATTVDSKGILHVTYTDPVDHSLKMATGTPDYLEQTSQNNYKN